jgi:cobalt-precorrin 5A hydrolase
MGGGEAMTAIVAGIGFRRGTSAGEIVALVENALDSAAVDRRALAVLATAAALAETHAFVEAAKRLAVEPASVGVAALTAAEPAVRTRSERSLAAHGVGSVAEAAALGAAGLGSALLLERIASSGATCALASRPVGGEAP